MEPFYTVPALKSIFNEVPKFFLFDFDFEQILKVTKCCKDILLCCSTCFRCNKLICWCSVYLNECVILKFFFRLSFGWNAKCYVTFPHVTGFIILRWCRNYTDKCSVNKCFSCFSVMKVPGLMLFNMYATLLQTLQRRWRKMSRFVCTSYCNL